MPRRVRCTIVLLRNKSVLVFVSKTLYQMKNELISRIEVGL